MTFREETVAGSIKEGMLLAQKHWEEVTAYKDFPLDPDWDLYIKLNEEGLCKCFIARDDQSKMVGYAVFFLRYSPHSRTVLCASADVLYVDPASRGGTGMLFILFCEKELKAAGVQAIVQHVSIKHNFGRALERHGYHLHEYIYSKKL
jgi:hypothetical protein